MNTQPDMYHLRNFENLVYDAVHLLYLAHDVDPEQDQHGYEFSYARTAILNTLLLFECGANCCLDALTLPGTYAEDIDKLPFMSKFEFFLNRIKPNARFDRGCKETQAVAELKKLRDDYVHPKVKKKQYSKADDWGADFGNTIVLQIPNDPARWESGQMIFSICSSCLGVISTQTRFASCFLARTQQTYLLGQASPLIASKVCPVRCRTSE